MNTPKEKAQELFFKFFDNFYSPLFYKSQAKKCVIFLCDEYIKYANGLYDSKVIIEYWQEVKDEIEKI
jgi:alanine-alpha-ketoisovalerate/valine-pyruvate aminotransferase